MDKQTKTEIKAVVREAIKEAMEVYNEVWVSDEDMYKHISFMTKRWLRDHGKMLPRTQAEWIDENGVVHTSSFSYQLHKILAMMADGRIKALKNIS
jgi:hypothetical protein